MAHEQRVSEICAYALKILAKDKLRFRPMRRKNNRVNTKRGFVIGRTNLRTGLITIDIYTPKTREEKKVSSVLRTLCHEVAHHEKKPYRERFRWRYITRQHYPEFYKQVNKNILKLKKDKVLSKYFNN